MKPMKLKILFCFSLIVFIPLSQESSPEVLDIKTNNKEEILRLINEFQDEEKAGQSLDEIRKLGTSALPHLVEGLKNKNSAVRKNSIIAVSVIFQRRSPTGFRLGEINFKDFEFLTSEEKNLFEEAFKVLLTMADDLIVEIRRTVACHLGLFGDERAVSVLEKSLKDPDDWVKFEAYLSLGKMNRNYNYFTVMTGKTPERLEDFLEFLGDTTSFGIYTVAQREIVKKFGKEAVPALLKVASSDKEPDRQRAIKLLGELKAEEAVQALGEHFKKNPIDTTTLYALTRIGTPEAIDILVQYGLKHKDAKIIINTSRALLPEHRNTVIPFLKELAKHKDGKVRLEAGIILVEQKEKAGIPVLIELLRNPTQAGNARIMLEGVTKQNFGRLPPVISKKMVDDYVNKWKNWWDKNKDTSKFPNN
jgi:HEAT repeat protein